MSMQFFHSFLSSKSVITCSQPAGQTHPRPGLPAFLSSCSTGVGRGAPNPAYRQTAPGIAHSQEGVMLAVAKVSCAACQLRPAAVLAMVVGQGAIVHHHRDVREHTLRPRYQLLHSQPHLWEAAGAPTTPIPGGCF